MFLSLSSMDAVCVSALPCCKISVSFYVGKLTFLREPNFCALLSTFDVDTDKPFSLPICSRLSRLQFRSRLLSLDKCMEHLSVIQMVPP